MSTHNKNGVACDASPPHIHATLKQPTPTWSSAVDTTHGHLTQRSGAALVEQISLQPFLERHPQLQQIHNRHTLLENAIKSGDPSVMIPVSPNAEYCAAVDDTLHVLPSQHQTVSSFACLSAPRTQHSPVYAQLAIRPARMRGEKERAAADAFDELHQRRTELATGMVGQRGDHVPDTLPSLDRRQGNLAFAFRLAEVQRTRYCVENEIKGIHVHTKREPRAKAAWTLFVSAWEPRSRTSDAKDFWDTPHVKRMAFEHDWTLAMQKHTLDKKLERAARKLPTGAAAVCTIQEMKDALFQHFDMLYGMFHFYATLGGADDVFAMSKQGFTQLIGDAELSNEQVTGQRLADLYILFEGVNAKGSTKSKGAADEMFNHRKTLNREEWLALIVQMVIARHVTSPDALHISAAIDQFVGHMGPRLPSEVVHDANVFRSEMCYLETVDNVLKAHFKSLKMVYDVFSYGTGAIGDGVYSIKLMDISEYNMFVGRLHLIDQFITARDIELAFVQARMLVMAEGTVKGRSRLVQLSFEDFLEVLVRLAYQKALPTNEEIAECGCMHAGDFLAALDEDAARKAEFNEKRTRRWGERLDQPIALKLHHFLAWMFYCIRGGEYSDKELTKKQVDSFRTGRVIIAHDD